MLPVVVHSGNLKIARTWGMKTFSNINFTNYKTCVCGKFVDASRKLMWIFQFTFKLKWNIDIPSLMATR